MGTSYGHVGHALQRTEVHISDGSSCTSDVDRIFQAQSNIQPIGLAEVCSLRWHPASLRIGRTGDYVYL